MGTSYLKKIATKSLTIFSYTNSLNTFSFVKDMTKHFGVFSVHSSSCCSLAKCEC